MTLIKVTIVPEAIFTYGGENVSQSEFKQGLINAYSNAAKHFKFFGFYK